MSEFEMRAPQEIASGVWLWFTPHRNWDQSPEWPERVAQVAYATSNELCLFDPLVSADREGEYWGLIDELKGHRMARVLLTAPWHERSAAKVQEHYGARVWADARGSSRISVASTPGPLPEGVEAFVPDGMHEGEVAFFLGQPGTLIVAEFLLGTPNGLRLLFSPAMEDRTAFLDSLQRLKTLHINQVIVAHGQCVLENGSEEIGAALEQQLAT